MIFDHPAIVDHRVDILLLFQYNPLKVFLVSEHKSAKYDPHPEMMHPEPLPVVFSLIITPIAPDYLTGMGLKLL